jgi:hypothetical protein
MQYKHDRPYESTCSYVCVQFPVSSFFFLSFFLLLFVCSSVSNIHIYLAVVMTCVYVEMRRQRERICSFKVITLYVYKRKKMTEVFFSIRVSKAEKKEVTIGHKRTRHSKFFVHHYKVFCLYSNKKILLIERTVNSMCWF